MVGSDRKEVTTQVNMVLYRCSSTFGMSHHHLVVVLGLSTDRNQKKTMSYDMTQEDVALIQGLSDHQIIYVGQRVSLENWMILLQSALELLIRSRSGRHVKRILYW